MSKKKKKVEGNTVIEMEPEYVEDVSTEENTSEKSETEQNEKETKKMSKKNLIGLGVGIGAAVLAIGAAFFAGRNHSDYDALSDLEDEYGEDDDEETEEDDLDEGSDDESET